MLEASRKYIRRNRQLSDYQKQSNAEFLKLAGRLFHFRLQRPFLPSKKARNWIFDF